MELETGIDDATLSEWLKGFAARVEYIQKLSPPAVTKRGDYDLDSVSISEQYAKVLRCVESVIRTNGKTARNLRVSAKKLNEMLVDAERALKEIL